jgi:ubiquinone/menaquinone biosynthesis C-methylase UbiE
MTTSYDEVAYPTTAFLQTHPDRLAAHAALMGVPFAPPSRCRVLDVGGGDGMNIIGMAVTYPDSEFVSFDLSQSAVERGQEVIQGLGLSNVRLFAADVTSVDVGQGSFDYLIAHGFYSWVPAEARDAVLALAGRCLSPSGVAFVSYSTLPGGHIKQAVRDLLMFEVEGISDPQERLAVAHGKLQEVVDSYPETEIAQKMLKARCKGLLDIPGAVLLHDDLGEVFHNLYLSDFLDHAGVHGLKFLTEADRVRCLEGISPEGSDCTDADIVANARATDFKMMHGFRQTLLVRADLAVDRLLDLRRLSDLYVSCPGQPQGDGRFRIRDTEFRAPDDVLTKALTRLTAVFPLALPVKELVDDDKRLAALMRMYTTDLVRLHVEPQPFQTTISERPQASALARLQIARGEERLITLAHTVLPVDNPAARTFVSLLDGSRTQGEIVEEMARLTGAPIGEISERVAEKLAELAKMPMLAG